MVRRHLPRSYRAVCLTDRPALVPAPVEPITITPLVGPGWWSKLQLFNPAHGWRGRVLYLDLDSLVVDDLSPVVDVRAPFATLADDGSAFQPKDRRLRVVKRFNSSVMVFDAGTYTDLWSAWTPAVAARLWGDQDWLAERHPNAWTLPPAWCPRLSAIGAGGAVPAGARVILAKKPKPAAAAAQWPWVRAIWGGA
jgi:hypothetical protein